MKPSELFCFKDTINFAALLFFLATGNKKFQRAMMQMRSILPQLELSRTALLGCRLAARVFARLLTVGNYYLLLLLCRTLTSILKQDTHIQLIRHWERYFIFFLFSNQFPSKNAVIIENSFFPNRNLKWNVFNPNIFFN